MLFDHDSADSLRSRAEAASQKSAQPDKEEVVQHQEEVVRHLHPHEHEHSHEHQHPHEHQHDHPVGVHVVTPGSVLSTVKTKHHTKAEPFVPHPELVVPPGRSFALTPEDISKFNNDFENLRKYGGVQGIAHILRVDPKKGIDGTLEDLVARARVFGENTYPVSEAKSFWSFVFDALGDPTLMILIGCAVVSLAVGLTTEDPKSGWYDGGGVCFAIILVMTVASTSNYRQSLQFRALSAENQKILVNVTRAGKRMKMVIFELVVGDIVHLGIGDQIPGDGLLIKGATLVVDESSMTGESEPAVKDATHPFLISGCKVLDGTGSQLTGYFGT